MRPTPGRFASDLARPVARLRGGRPAVLWTLLLFVYMLAGTDLTPFHGDEATQITMSRDFAWQFLEGDVERLRFSATPVSEQEQALRLLNGTLNKTLIGLAWHLAGFQADALNEQWDWTASREHNLADGHMPGGELLRVARRPSALLMAGGVFVIFALGNLLGGQATAFLASLYYALNPTLLINGQRAMMEGSLIFFSLLVVLTGLQFARSGRPAPALLLGVSAGLALAAKHNAAFTLVAVFAGCGLALRMKRPRALPNLALAAAVAGALFLALNPAWWGDPVARAATVLQLRQELLAEQVARYGGHETPGERLAGFWRRVFVNPPQYFEVPGWQAALDAEIARHQASPWRGFSLGSVVAGAPALLLSAAGLWQLLRQPGPCRAVIGAWALFTPAAILLLTPLDWARYYLPLYPLVGLLAASGLVTCARALTMRWNFRTG